VFGEERRQGARRGAFGGVVGGVPAPTREGGEEEAPQTPSHRGGERGGRGRGRGRGGRGGRGDGGAGSHNPRPADASKPQKAPGAEDFPDLPPKEKAAQDTTEDKPKTLDFPISIKGKGTKPIDTNIPAESKATTEAVSSPRPGQLKQQESFGLGSPAAGKSWADQVEGAS
jgi:hypothetical protein